MKKSLIKLNYWKHKPIIRFYFFVHAVEKWRKNGNRK